MSDVGQHQLEIGHPAPQRQDAPLPAMLFGFCAAPAAWMGQLLAEFATTSYLCLPGGSRAVDALPAWLTPLLIAINLLALLLAGIGAGTAYRLARRTAQEHRQSGGDLLDVGEGRTRFLATFALFSSAAFCIGTLANTFSLFVVPLCR